MSKPSKTLKKPKPDKPQFSRAEAIELAERILAAPPARDFIQRPALLPHVVFRAVVPAELCLEANKLATGVMQRCYWKLGKLKAELWSELSSQSIPWLKYRPWWPLDLDHRPQVIAVKFSSHSNDAGSNPGKAAIDMLTVRKLLNAKEQRYTEHRLGIIRDDRRSEAEQISWWEPLPRKYHAFLLLEVRV